MLIGRLAASPQGSPPEPFHIQQRHRVKIHRRPLFLARASKTLLKADHLLVIAFVKPSRLELEWDHSAAVIWEVNPSAPPTCWIRTFQWQLLHRLYKATAWHWQASLRLRGQPRCGYKEMNQCLEMSRHCSKYMASLFPATYLNTEQIISKRQYQSPLGRWNVKPPVSASYDFCMCYQSLSTMTLYLSWIRIYAIWNSYANEIITVIECLLPSKPYLRSLNIAARNIFA